MTPLLCRSMIMSARSWQVIVKTQTSKVRQALCSNFSSCAYELLGSCEKWHTLFVQPCLCVNSALQATLLSGKNSVLKNISWRCLLLWVWRLTIHDQAPVNFAIKNIAFSMKPPAITVPTMLLLDMLQRGWWMTTVIWKYFGCDRINKQRNQTLQLLTGRRHIGMWRHYACVKRM